MLPRSSGVGFPDKKWPNPNAALHHCSSSSTGKALIFGETMTRRISHQDGV